jgi:hypothetical protein
VSENVTRYFEVVEAVSSTKQILLTDKNGYTLEDGDVITNPLTNSSYTVISVDKLPTLDKYSGELLYIDNRTMVSYSDQQLVTLRTVIKL